MKESILVLEVQNKAALPIMESACRHGRKVIVGSALRWCAGTLSRYGHRRVRYPPPNVAEAEFRGWLLEFVKTNRPEMLYPTDDLVTAICAELQDELARYTKLAMPALQTFLIGRNKVATLKAAVSAKVAIPKTWYFEPGRAAETARAVSYPCLIKPAISAGARGITRVNSAAELLEHFPMLERQFGECFAQDYVPQTGMQYKVDLVMARDGRLVAGVVYEKLRFYPPNGGSSVLNRTVRRPDILEAAERLARHIGWYGFCDFDFITDPRDGVVKLMEINPRFPESFRATYAAGLDMTEMLWEMAHGRTPPVCEGYLADRYMRFMFGDVMWLATCKNRRSQLASWLTFLGPKLSYQVCAWRDPGAIIGYLLENALLLLDPKTRRARFRLEQARRG